MITPFRILIASVLQVLVATAAPVGICLHAYSPEAPAEKIECFEFEKVERAAADYRFFPRADKSVMVTAYRFRGTILYKPDLAPTHPEFDKLLKLYEDTARATPSTRPFLNPRILAMRGQAAGVAKQAESLAQLPTITLADGSKLLGCTMSKIENGFVSIRHQDGISKVSLTELDATEKKALTSTAEGWSLEDPAAASKDSTGTFARIVFKNGLLLKKAKFKEVADGNLVFMADGKSVSVPADQFPGELSVLGEEVVKSLAPVKNETTPEPSVASSGGDDSPTAPIQTKRSDDIFGGAFVLPDMGEPEAEKPIPETAVEKKILPSRSKSNEIIASKREAEQGMQETVDLAERYIIGEGVIQNLPEAVRLLRKTADRGFADAQFHLGSCYTFGRGVAKDEAAAASWFQKAAEQGHAEAQFNLSSCYYQGTGVAQDKKKWIEWLVKSADGGCAEAQYALGVAHIEGIGVQKDEARAAEYLQKASEQNYAKAQYELGDLYYWGKGVHEDKAKATKLFLLSAEGGYAKAQSFVGAMYHHAWGVPMDFVKGTDWYMLAARQGVPNDQCTVGNCYAMGKGVEQSDTKAFEWYLKAAEQGYLHGQYYVGLCYKEGRGVPEDRVLAMKYFRSAADQGSSDAKAEILASQKADKGKNWNLMVIVPVGLMLVLAIVKVAFVFMKRSSRGGDTITKPQQSTKVSSRAKSNLKHREVPQTDWIKFTCPDCENHISKEQQFAGGSVECPTCGIDVIVPTALVDATMESHYPAVKIGGQSPDVYTSGETHGENEMSREDAEHSLGDRLKTGAKDGWSSIKSQSKQAALRTQIEKLKNVELRMAHHSLGKKCFETGIFDLQFREQFQAIRNLDATIAEKRSDEEVEDDETKVAALKRMGIHAVKESQAQALLLKRRGLLAELGKSAFLIGGSADLSGIGPERAVIEAIEARILNKEAEALEIQKAGEGKSRVPMIAIVALLIIVVSAGASMGLKSLAGGGDSLRSGKYDAEAAFGQEAARLQGVMRDNDGKPCRVCDGAGHRGLTGCPGCKVGLDDFKGQGTVRTPSGYIMACSRCQGSGTVPLTCNACGGTGNFRSPY